jgi:hypothetical protein
MVRPVLMRPEHIIDVQRAVFDTKKSESTIRRLCRRYALARQTFPGAPLEISRVGLEMALHGDTEAIELLRDGYTEDPAVARYIRHLGLPF